MGSNEPRGGVVRSGRVGSGAPEVIGVPAGSAETTGAVIAVDDGPLDVTAEVPDDCTDDCTDDGDDAGWLVVSPHPARATNTVAATIAPTIR